MMKEALYYNKLKNNIAQCILCPNFCILNQGETGKCRARKNIRGRLISLSYGMPIAIHTDPIEKKPIFHMLPGSFSYSIGTAGCQLSCLFCQNYDISQATPDSFQRNQVEPKEIVKAAIKNNCKSISYTYSDPVAFYEYALDTAVLAKKAGLKNIIVSNGYINPEPLKKLCKYIDAANIDLKGFNEKFYKSQCSGKLKPVLESLKMLKSQKVLLEITNLIIPDLNDNLKEIELMVKWIKKNLGKDQVLHFSRYHPSYKLSKQQTPETTLEKAYKIAKKHLSYVYIGNLHTENRENTYCAKCNALLIKRDSYRILENNIKKSKCHKCSSLIPGIWQ